MKTVLNKEKKAAAEKAFKKIFKRKKTDVDKKKKENNAVDIEKDTEIFKLAYHWKLNSKLNFNI